MPTKSKSKLSPTPPRRSSSRAAVKSSGKGSSETMEDSAAAIDSTTVTSPAPILEDNDKKTEADFRVKANLKSEESPPVNKEEAEEKEPPKPDGDYDKKPMPDDAVEDDKLDPLPLPPNNNNDNMNMNMHSMHPAMGSTNMNMNMNLAGMGGNNTMNNAIGNMNPMMMGNMPFGFPYGMPNQAMQAAMMGGGQGSSPYGMGMGNNNNSDGYLAIPPSISSSRVPNTKNFPETLFDIISDEQNNNIISWLSHGKGFIIHSKQLFGELILPKYFDGAKFTSFTRRLKRWQFNRVPRGPELGAYYNNYFMRDKPDWVRKVSGT